MNILKMLFSTNSKHWLSTVENKYDEEWGTIVKNFFIQDNISYEKYSHNMYWEGNALSIERSESKLALCTSTYRKYFSDSQHSKSRRLNNGELGYRIGWFYCGYPDVAKWADDNYDSIRRELELLGISYSPYFPENIQILRYIVSAYQKTNKSLECQL